MKTDAVRLLMWRIALILNGARIITAQPLKAIGGGHTYRCLLYTSRCV
ncbi:hypothetical protein [Erwinia amylovora]